VTHQLGPAVWGQGGIAGHKGGGGGGDISEKGKTISTVRLNPRKGEKTAYPGGGGAVWVDTRGAAGKKNKEKGKTSMHKDIGGVNGGITVLRGASRKFES